MKVIRLTPVLVALCACSAAVATPTVSSLGASITISDGNYSSSVLSWYGNHEDNETEAVPTTLKGQQWDLEGMYLNGQSLTLVGGFNFQAGTTYSNYNYRTGDIFIDVDGNPKYTLADNGASGKGGVVANTFGYDYVMHFNNAVNAYDVYSIDNTSMVARATDVAASNPWRYVSGGTLLDSGVAIGGFGLLDSTTVSGVTTFGTTGTGLLGYNGNNNHYYLTVDTSFLPANTLATFHYTIECGNDNLMGRATTAVPETGSTLLLVTGALGLLAASRRKGARR